MDVLLPRTPSISSREWGWACLGAVLIQAVFFTILTLAGASDTQVKKAEEAKPEVIPIAVKPVLDDLPLLKLGSKQKVKQKLPDIWKKQAPVKRLEERSAPSAQAEDKATDLPKSDLADKDHEAPTKDDELIKEANPDLEDSDNKDESASNVEGAADGVKEGTETDPLKARAVDLYRAKVLAWFNARFRPPVDSIPCAELKKLSAGVQVQIGGDRSVAGFTISSPSGNPLFDAKVESTMRGLIGQELPPPPPLYPDILSSVVTPRLSGANASCSN